jgi:hypothetical protein
MVSYGLFLIVVIQLISILLGDKSPIAVRVRLITDIYELSGEII